MKQEEQKQKDQQRKRTVSKFNRKHKKVKIRNDHLDDMEEDIEIVISSGRTTTTPHFPLPTFVRHL